MSKRQVTITLHHIDDLAYSKFVMRLIRKLFGVSPSVYHSLRDSVNNIVISRVGIVRYLHELGLPIGNKVKQQFDIPIWIKKEKRYYVACVRGLFDTDGSVFAHSYVVNGKQYHYKKTSFTSLSKPLLMSFFRLLRSVGLHPRLSQGKDARLDSIADVQKYFAVIGSHNPKHLKRYRA